MDATRDHTSRAEKTDKECSEHRKGEGSQTRPPVLSPLPTKKNAETADEMCRKFTRCSPRCQLGGVFRPGSMSASDVVDVARWGDPPASHGFCSAERPLRLRQALDEHCWPLTLNTPELGVVRRRAKKTAPTVSLDLYRC